MVFKRKIYDKLKQWKELSGGSSAVLLEGARRIGKSTIVEEFARNEYDDYMILDFAKEGKDIKNNFTENMDDLDTFFRNLFLLKGRSKMPLGIMSMGIFFNLLNGTMQGEWIFYLSPADRYTLDWLTTPQFIIGSLLFFAGMTVNIHSDYIIRHLRKPGDTGHYLPQGGFFRYVTSANYFGEIVEWCGFALLTWSWAGAVFAWWTAANLIPRADRIYHRYREMFGEQVGKRKRIIPFIY